MKTEPRVAFFPDSFIEVNGVAHTSRLLVGYARARKLPLLCVYGSEREQAVSEGSVTKLALPRSPCGFALDADLRNDLLFWRHARRAIDAVRKFRANLVHITGPNDTGQLGAWVAWQLGLPLVISWHTNLHEYAGQRLSQAMARLPRRWRAGLAHWAETQTLRAVLRFYRLGQSLLAPNEELRALLAEATGKSVYLMQRGVNTVFFNPAKRQRRDGVFQIGYVGRLTPEKNVRLLAEVEKCLLAAGRRDFRIVITGAGSEQAWLARHMQYARFTGVLKGEALAQAYANHDLFIFPSPTDTFGNAVLEAQASGVPALVSAHGGPKFIIENGVTGLVADGAANVAAAVLALCDDRTRLAQMAAAACARAGQFAWEQVFARVYASYEDCLQSGNASHRSAPEQVIAVETAALAR